MAAFQNLDEVKKLLETHVADVAYVQLFERARTPGGTENSVPMGRWDPPSSPSEQDPFQGLEYGSEGTAEATAAHPVWIESCLNWIRHRAMMFIAERRGPLKFQLKLFRKGAQYITSCQFVGTPSASDPTDRLEAAMNDLSRFETSNAIFNQLPRLDPATFPSIDEIKGAAHFEILEMMALIGAWNARVMIPATATQIQLAQGTIQHYAGLADQQRTVITRQEEEIRELRAEVRSLEASIAAEQREREAKQKNIGALINEVGALGRTYISAQAELPAGLLPLLTIVRSDAALLATLSNPKIVALLQDPEQRQILVRILTQAGEVYAAEKAAAQESTKPGTPAPPPNIDTQHLP